MLTEIVNGLTDDQVALIGCSIALILCGTIMSLSYYIGRGSRSNTSRLDHAEGEVIPLINRPAQSDAATRQTERPRRDAA